MHTVCAAPTDQRRSGEPARLLGQCAEVEDEERTLLESGIAPLAVCTWGGGATHRVNRGPWTLWWLEETVVESLPITFDLGERAAGGTGAEVQPPGMVRACC